MFCKSINSARARLARVSAWLGLVFFPKIKSRLCIKKLGIIYITSSYPIWITKMSFKIKYICAIINCVYN